MIRITWRMRWGVWRWGYSSRTYK